MTGKNKPEQPVSCYQIKKENDTSETNVGENDSWRNITIDTIS
jgi:hypothetical protein